MTETRTSAGRVRGTDEAGVAVFRGIPFAAPPVGDLRFAAPAPPRPWDGVREATTFGPPPPQPAGTGGRAFVAGDTDWLTLNVWAPDPGPGAGLPVMVWIHGGAYTIGAADLPEYDGARLARDGVVLVTANHRVGVEGFAHVEGAPDNRGLLDQVAVLKWVQENIGAFGGDPARVTVFGQSAGGGSVAALLTMPRAAGLFGRAVAQSVQGTTFTPELARDIGSAFAAEIGLRATTADLADVDPELLVAASDEVIAKAGAHVDRWGPAAYRSILFSPVVDGDVLPASPWQVRHDVDLLVGHTRDENRLFVVFGEVDPADVAAAEERYAPGPYEEGDPDRLYDLVLSDWMFRMPSLHLAERAARAHVYELTWGGTLGACHGLDVPLVFGNLTRGRPASLIGDVATAGQVSAAMRAAWVAFATHGDPGWPVFDDDGLVQLFDTEPAVVPYPETESRRVWRDHVFAPLPLR
ncbi:carboxylesterase/lipase family protein [Pseudonocardia sp. N23]|uniref:carboxylesterase/lipase family protein n=1 Tax=Pseudonocardia sp. N23 TaxID=1987376 RepID=UPI000BFB4E67|nr:carboxylesterase family protein [Pseudonocardia sp. N23]GAY08439.1 putative carboxylesterase [Pseudonocardia sp. N23]